MLAITKHSTRKIKKSLRVFLTKTNLQGISKDRLLYGSKLESRFGVDFTASFHIKHFINTLLGDLGHGSLWRIDVPWKLHFY